jgi:hypothetical protein
VTVTALPKLPSAEALVVSWLKSRPALTTIHGGRVGTRLKTTLPAIRVQRIGGAVVNDWEDHPVVQIECWAADEDTADDLSRTVVAELPTARGGQVKTYEIESGPYMVPDDPALSTNSRYNVDVRFITTP